jgi:hypothetical protein
MVEVVIESVNNWVVVLSGFLISREGAAKGWRAGRGKDEPVEITTTERRRGDGREASEQRLVPGPPGLGERG